MIGLAMKLVRAIGVAESVTVQVTVKVPRTTKACRTVVPVTLGLPSPKFQEKLYGPVPPVAVAVKLTLSPMTIAPDCP